MKTLLIFAKEKEKENLTLLQCSSNFMKMVVPMIISCLFMQLEFTINTFFAGRFDDPAKIAGVGLGTSLLNLACFFPLVGMNYAIDTLVSQAFGAKRLELCGAYLNRGRLINTVLFIPIVIILFCSKQILTLLHQQPEVIQHAYEYIKICLFGLYLRTMFDMKKRFLNCMNITWVPMLAQVVAALLHVLWCYIFAEYFELQVFGLGVATFITDLILVITIELFSLTVPIIKELQVSLDYSALKNWWEYIKLGAPNSVSLTVLMLSNEILIFLSGILSVHE